MNAIPFLFPVFFALLGIGAMYVISKRGWKRLAGAYRYDAVGDMRRIGTTSIAINGINYNNCLTLFYNQQGMYLKPIIFFRLFHPPILIPWAHIKDLGDKKILFRTFRRLQVGDPVIATLLMRRDTFAQLPMGK